MMRLSRVKYLVLLVAAFLLALIPMSTQAAEPRAGDSVTVGPGETINDDLYAFAGNVDIRGTVNGDVIASGGNVTVSGTVTGDVMVAGGSLNLVGQVDGSIRAAGGNVVVNGSVGDDLVVAGGNLTLGSGGSVGRDLLAAGGSTAVDGPVGRNILGGMGSLTIGAPVEGDVRVSVGNLRLTDRAVVGGDVVYESDTSAEIAEGAQVAGSITRREPERRVDRFPLWRDNPVILWLRGLIGTFALGAFFVLLWPGFSQRASGNLRRSPWISLGVGFALSLAIPVLAALLFAVGLFVGGWWLGLLAVAAYGLLLALGFVVAGLFLGRWGLELRGAGRVHRLWALLLGLAVLVLVALVPILGGLVVWVAMLFGLGALSVALVQSRQEPPAAAEEARLE